VSKDTQDKIRETHLNFHPEIDIRGMRGDEALETITHYIDDDVLVGASRLRILHGTGNGILRQLIRQYLNTVPQVTSARDEDVRFGGAGITVVQLR
jgi:DNA mismatch repair protein MutS2